MTERKSVLIVGLDPALIDFSQPGYAPGMDAAKVLAGLKRIRYSSGILRPITLHYVNSELG